MNIERLTLENLNAMVVVDVAAVFVAYRRFYGKAGEDEAAIDFVRRRLESGDSIIWRLVSRGQTEGFCQVYPAHSSLLLTTDWCLNDLFVSEAVRGAGAGRLLVNRVIEDATKAGASSVWLETQHSNAIARSLYVSLGFEQQLSENETFLTYKRILKVNHA